MISTKLSHPQPAFGSGNNGNGGLTVSDFGSGGSNRSRQQPEDAEAQDSLGLDFLGPIETGALDLLPNFAEIPSFVRAQDAAPAGDAFALPEIPELSEQDHALLKLRAIFADPDNPEDMAAIQILQAHEQRKVRAAHEPDEPRESFAEQPKSLALLAYLEF